MSPDADTPHQETSAERTQREYIEAERTAEAYRRTPTAELRATLSDAQQLRLVDELVSWEATARLRGQWSPPIPVPGNDAPQQDPRLIAVAEDNLNQARIARGECARRAAVAALSPGQPDLYRLIVAVEHADHVLAVAKDNLAAVHAHIDGRTARRAAQAEREMSAADRIARLEAKLAEKA